MSAAGAKLVHVGTQERLTVEDVRRAIGPKTAILMAHARGVILLSASEKGLPVWHYSATQIKRLLTGSGKASKEQMQRAIQNELGLSELLEPNDVADAFAVALCHYYTSKSQLRAS